MFEKYNPAPYLLKLSTSKPSSMVSFPAGKAAVNNSFLSPVLSSLKAPRRVWYQQNMDKVKTLTTNFWFTYRHKSKTKTEDKTKLLTLSSFTNRGLVVALGYSQSTSKPSNWRFRRKSTEVLAKRDSMSLSDVTSTKASLEAVSPPMDRSVTRCG